MLERSWGNGATEREGQSTLYQVLVCGWLWSQMVWATNPVVRQRLAADMAWWLAEVRAALEMWSP